MISPYAFPGIRRTDLPVSYTRIAKQSKDPEETLVTSELIFAAIKEVTTLEPDELRGRLRLRRVVNGRYIYAFFARTLLGMPLAQIGEMLNRDHTTIMHALKCYKDSYDLDLSFKNLASRVRTKIYVLSGEELVSL
jgi:chromosomal replication initiation ATPase DnaA